MIKNLDYKHVLLFFLLVNEIFVNANFFLPINLRIQTDPGSSSELMAVLKKSTQKLGFDGKIINYNSNYKSVLVMFLTNYVDTQVDDETFYFFAIPHPLKECNSRIIHSYIPANLEYSMISHFAHKGYKNVYLFSPNTRIDIYDRLKYITMLYDMKVLNSNNKTLEYHSGMLDTVPKDSILFVRYEDRDKIERIAGDYNNKPELLLNNVILVLPSIINEYTTHSNKDVYKNVYILSGYFQSIEDEENKKFIDELQLNSNQYVTDSIYSSLMLLSFFKTVPLNLPMLSYEFVLSNITNTCIESPILSTDSICYISNNCLIRPFYLGIVNDNGDISVVAKLFTNFPSEPFDNFYSVPYQPCITPFLLTQSYGICYISNTNSSVPNYRDILDGLFMSVNSINYNNMDSYRYHLLVANPFLSIKSQYEFCLSFEDVVAFVYYTHTNGSAPLLPYINENNNNNHLVLTVGYDFGQFCHPNFFHIGISTPTIFYITDIIKKLDYTMIIASETRYGIKSKDFSENYLKLKGNLVETILIKDYKSNTELGNAMKRISDFVIKHPTAFILCYLGYPYTTTFLKEYKTNVLTKSITNPIIVYDMTINDIPTDSSDYAKYKYLNTIVTFNGSCLNNNHSNSFCSNIISDLITPTQFTYYGYLSMTMFDNLYKSSSSFDIEKIATTQLSVDANIDNNNYVYVNDQNRMKIKISFVKTTDVKNELIILDTSETSISFDPWKGGFIDHHIMMCDFQSPTTDYTKEYSTVTVLNIGSIGNEIESLLEYTESLIPSNSTHRIVVITESLGNNNQQELLRNMINKYKPIAIIGGDTKRERELISPILEEYKIPLFVTARWNGNECFRYVYHFGPSADQLVVSILYSFISQYNNVYIIVDEEFSNYGLDHFFKIMSFVDVTYEILQYNDSICNTVLPNIPEDSIVYIIVEEEKVLSLIKCDNKKDNTMFIVGGYDSSDSTVEVVKNGVFFTTSIIFPDYNHGVLYKPILNDLISKSLNPDINFYSRLMYIYYIMVYITYTIDNYGETSEYLMKVLNSYVFSISDYDGIFFGKDNQLIMPIQTFFSNHNELTLVKPLSLSSGSIIVTNNYVNDRLISVCDFTYPSSEKNVTKVMVGGIVFTGEDIYKETINVISTLSMYIDDFNRRESFPFYIELILKKASSLDELHESMKYFVDNDFHHVIGGMNEKFNKIILSYCEKNEILYWYIGVATVDSSCSSYLIDFSLTSSLVSFFDYIYKTSTNPIVFIYSETIKNMKLDVLINEIFQDVDLKTFSEDSPLGYIEISNILLKIPNGGSIVLMENYKTLEFTLNNIAKVIKSFKNAKDYIVYVPFNLYVSLHFNDLPITVRFLSLIDYTNSSSNSIQFRKIYSKYQFFKRPMTILEEAASNMMSIFVELIQMHDVNDISSFQNDLIHNTFDTLSGNFKFTADLTCGSFFNVIEYYENSTYSILYRNPQTGVSYLDYRYKKKFCNFSEGLEGNITLVERTNVGFLLDDVYQEYHQLYQNIFELAIERINSLGGICSKQLSYVAVIYNSENITKFITDFKYVNEASNIHIFFGLLRDNALNVLSDLLSETNSLFYHLRPHWSSNLSSSIFFMYGSFDNYFIPGLYWIMSFSSSVVIVYSQSDLNVNHVNLFIENFQDSGISILNIIEIPHNCDDYTPFTYILIKSLAKDTIVVNLLRSSQTNKLLINLDQKIISPITMVSFLVDPGLRVLFETSVVKHYMFTVFNPTDVNIPDDNPLYNYYKSYDNGYGYPSPGMVLFYESVLLFYRVSLESEKNKNSYYENHFTIPVNLPSGSVYINSENYLNHYIYLLYYKNGKFETSYYSDKLHPFFTPSSSFVAVDTSSYDLKEVKAIDKSKMGIAFVYALSGDSRDQELPLFLASISGFYTIQNELKYYDLFYTVFDTKSDISMCRTSTKMIVDSGKYSFIIGGPSPDCFYEIEKEIENTPIYYFYSSPFCGQSCYKNVIFTGGLPNQYYSNAFSHFSPFFATNSYMYLFYDSKMHCSNVSHSIITKTIEGTALILLSFDLHEATVTDMINTVDIMQKNNGLILFIYHKTDYLMILLKELYNRKMKRENYPFLSYYLSETQFETVPVKLKEGIYMFGSYFQTDKDDEFKNLVYEFTMHKTVTTRMSSVYISFLFIKELLNNSPHPEEVVDISRIYNKEVKTDEGTIKLATNNMLSKKFQLAQYFEDGSLHVIANYRNPTSPDAYDWFITPNFICDFTDEKIMEKGYQNSNSYMMVVYPQTEEDFLLLGISNSILAPINGNGGINHNRIIFKYTQPPTIQACEVYAKMFNETEVYLALYISAPYECIEKFIEATKDHPKPINIISQFDEEICIRDVYTSALYPGISLSNLFIQLMSKDNDLKILLIHSRDYDNKYTQIHNVVISLAIKLINDLNFENPNLYILLKEYIREYEEGFYIVMDNNDEDEINKVIQYVYNYTKDGNVDGIIRYISYYNQPSFISKTPYYYIIDSTPHIFIDANNQIKSPDVSNELYDAYITVADSIKSNKLTDKIASMYNMFHFWASFNQFQLPAFSKEYYDLIYNLEVDSVEGRVFMQQNNRLMKSLTYSYINNEGKLFEYVVGPLKAHSWNIYSRMDVVNVSVCSWPYANGEVVIPVFKVGIIYPISGMYSDSTIYSLSMLLVCMAQFNIRTSIDLGYYLQPIIKDTFSTDDGLKEAFKYMSNEKVRIVFTHIRGNTFNEKEYFDKDILYLNIGFSFELFESSNVIDFGLPVTILSYLYYREILKYSYDLFIIADHSLFSNSLYNDLTLRLSSTSINQNSYIIDEQVDFDKVILSLNSTCYSYESSTCFIIYSVDGNLNIKGMESIYRNGLLDDDKYIIYTPFIDRNNQLNLSRIYKGVKTIETYIPELNQTDYDFLTPQYNEFENFKRTYFPQLAYTSGFMENSYVSFSMLVSTLKKFLSPNNITLLIESISYHQYSTPSGSIYISKDLKAQRRYYEIMVQDNNFNYRVLSHTELLSPKTYDSSIYQEDFIENNTSIFALILDYSDRAHKRLSHLMLLLFDNLIRDENNQISTLSTKMTYKVIAVRHIEYDQTLIYSLFENEKIQILFGCQSQYSYSLIKARMVGNSKKLLYSLNYPLYPECDDNIIHIKPSLRTVLIPSIEAVQNTSGRNAIIVMSVFDGHENDAIDVSVFITNYLINNTQIVPINVTIVNDDDYEEKFDGIMKILSSERMKTIIFNMLDYKHLLLFEKLYIENGLSSIHHLQVVYDIEEYLMGYNIITKLTGHFFPRTYSSDRSLPSTINFENYIDVKIGSIEFITETLSTLESSFSIYLASVKQALSLANIDNINYAVPTIDYIRRGTQLVDISTSSGNKHGSITNYIESVFEIVEISSAGKAVPIDNKNLRVSLLPEVYYRNNSNCDCGPTTEIFRINQTIIDLIIAVCSIVSAFLVFEATVLIIFRKYKVLRAASYQFLIYFLISGVFVIGSSIASSLLATNDLECMFTQGFFYLCLINYSSILILRTWRIHVVYRNQTMTKQKITNEKIILRLVMILFACAFLSVVWGLIDPFSGYSMTLSKEYSTIIKNVYIKECDKNIYFMFFQGAILTFLFTCGIYFSWTTRNTLDEFNDSRSLSTTIGALAILELLYLVIEIVLATNQEAKFVLETLGICLVVLVSSGIFIVPKFYRIYKEYKKKQKMKNMPIKQFEPLFKTISKHNNKIHPYNRSSNKANQPVLLTNTKASNGSTKVLDKLSRIDEKNVNNNNNNKNDNYVNNQEVRNIDVYATQPEQDNINADNNFMNNTFLNDYDDDEEEEEE